MKQKLIISAFCALALAACTSKQNKSGDTANNAGTEAVANGENSGTIAQGAKSKCLTPMFLLANKDGSKFMISQYLDGAPEEIPDSLKNYKYILYEGKYYDVDFGGFQLSSEEDDTGRDTPYNFSNKAGWIYKMHNGKLLTNPQSEYDVFWGTPLLVDETFKNETKLLDVKKYDVEDAPVDVRDVKAKFEKLYGKKTIKFKLDATMGDYKYYVMQFETVDNKALGAIALVMPNGTTIFKNFPRDWDEFSTWREGDEGEFFGYDIVFATIENGNLTLYTYNGGEEGSTYQNYIVQGDSLTEGTVSKYFYHAPE